MPGAFAAPFAKQMRIGWILLWAAAISFGALVIDLLYVCWPYPAARGLEAFQDNVQREWHWIGQADPRIPRLGQTIFHNLYQALFVASGIDALLQEAGRPQQGIDQFAVRWVQGNQHLVLTAYYGLRLYALRLSVLLHMAPLLICALVAFVDGWAAWWLRRLSVARESSFLYHRGKRLFSCCCLAIGIGYLLPPVPLDPRWIVLPLLACVVVLLRNLMAGFKKYL